MKKGGGCDNKNRKEVRCRNGRQRCERKEAARMKRGRNKRKSERGRKTNAK